MALPPTPADAPIAEMPMPDAEMAEADGAMPVLFTVMGSPGGPFTLMAGDEPEGEGAMAADAPTFDTPQALMKGIMEILNPGTAGAEDEFASATKDGGPKGAPPLMG